MPRIGRPEKTQRGNAHKLTLRPHVFPAASIARFVDSDKRVSLCDVLQRRIRRAAPDDPVFRAQRTWDHGSEAGFMKRIEDAFQNLAAKIIDGWVFTIGDEDKRIANESVKNLERGRTDPRASTLTAIQEAFDRADVVFLDPGDIRNGGSGVRFKL